MAVGDYISEIQTSDRNTHPIGSSFWVSSETWNGKTNTEVENEIKTKFSNLTEIAWKPLKDKRDANSLIPGMQYRITDYTCTTTTAGTKSAGHVFDVIVTADSKNKLNEEARAINHKFDNPDDDYFKDCDLNAWKIWYCLDNDADRFAWADSSNDTGGNPVGRGVIYRMIDEFNNDVPYDFKNIQFYRQWDSSKSLWSTISSNNTGVPCYTFSSEGTSSTTSFTDMSLVASNNVYSNVIKKYVNSKKQTLNNNCFFGEGCNSNTFGDNCYNNTFGNNYYSNTFGNECYYNTFGNKCRNNTFGNTCQYNTFGDNCYNNTFGNNYYSNTFGNDCDTNTFGNYCYNNTFGNKCQCNTFGNVCGTNTFGNYIKYNTFGNHCHHNTFGSDCYDNTFGDNCSYNTFGNRIQESQFGDGVQYFSITTGSMTTKPTAANAKNYIRWLIVENGVRYVNAYVTGTTSSKSYCQNVRICLGVQGVDDNNRKTFDITSCINSKVNNVYQPANSQTTNV